MIARYLLGLLLITSLYAAESTPGTREWAEDVLRNPTSYFVNTYEREIFEKFRGKFRNVSIKTARVMNQEIRVDLHIRGVRNTYQLNMFLDNDKNIQQVYRHLPSLGSYEGMLDSRSVAWLGKLLYRIDAGDSAALLDLLFYEQVEVRYKNLASKREISKQLLMDFPEVVETRNITLSENQGVLNVAIDTQYLNGLAIRIPLTLTEDRDTAIQQEALYQRLLKIVQGSAAVRAGNEALNRYPSARFAGNNVVVPYLIERVETLSEISYVATGAVNSGAIVLPDADIQLQAVNPSTWLMNDMLLIDFHGPDAAVDEALTASSRFLRSLYNLFGHQQLDDNDSFHSHLNGTVHYRGYTLHELGLTSAVTCERMLQGLGTEGHFYFYPSRIDYEEDTVKIRGLLYITAAPNADVYHFAEVIATADKKAATIHTSLDLIFYPFVKSNHVSSMGRKF